MLIERAVVLTAAAERIFSPALQLRDISGYAASAIAIITIQDIQSRVTKRLQQQLPETQAAITAAADIQHTMSFRQKPPLIPLQRFRRLHHGAHLRVLFLPRIQL